VGEGAVCVEKSVVSDYESFGCSGLARGVCSALSHDND